MSAVLLAREPGAAYEVGVGAGRKVHLYRLYQTRSYEGALIGRPDRDTNRRVIEHAFAFARQKLRFRGVPTLIPVRPVAGRPGGLEEGDERLPDILCIGEFLWARPVRDPSQTVSSATFVWFQDSFALPIAPDVLAELREVDWNQIAEDWSE
ncbi:MAG TPA: hypothetical protein VFB20_08115 [Burkholderiales bacterium]|nr:hypothetical protein [Burkholderiales bacterium]